MKTNIHKQVVTSSVVVGNFGRPAPGRRTLQFFSARPWIPYVLIGLLLVGFVVPALLHMYRIVIRQISPPSSSTIGTTTGGTGIPGSTTPTSGDGSPGGGGSTSTNTTPGANGPGATIPDTSGACSGEAVKKASGEWWQCSFDDEFNGTSLDTAAWTPQLTATSAFTTGPVGAQACYVNSLNNISVGGGYLNLTARKESAPFVCKGLGGNALTSYTAGEVSSIYGFSQRNGRFEVRAKLPNTSVKGLQETLWLWPNNDTKYGTWPASGEIDFSEFYSNYANLDIPTIHYSYDFSTVNNGTYTNVASGNPQLNSEPGTSCKIDYTQFNSYALTWVPGQLRVDINNQPCVIDNYLSTVGASPAPFDQPFFIALTQALGINSNAFDPATTPLPAITSVDYVRIWK